MSRDKFGALGALLSAADLGRALAAIGAFYPDAAAGEPLDALAPSGERYAQRSTAAHGVLFTFPLRMRALQAYLRDHLVPFPAEPGGPGEMWLACWNRVVGSNPPALRFRIDLEGADNHPRFRIDLGWLARLLGQPELGCAGVFFSWPPEPLQFSWNWPLRIGIPDAPWSVTFESAVAAARYRDLYTLVDLGMAGASCDLLLIPTSLREATRAALDLGTMRASAVVVLGGTEETPNETDGWLAAMRRHFQAGAIGLAFVPAAERALWFQTLMAQIAHNATLDVALYSASRAREREHHRWEHPALTDPLSDLAPPLLFADATFVDEAQMCGLARRIGAAAARLPNGDETITIERSFSTLRLRDALPVRELGTQLAQGADALAFHQETADAAVLASVQKGIAAATGGTLQISPIVTGGIVTGAARPQNVELMIGRSRERPVAVVAPSPRPVSPSPAAPARSASRGARSRRAATPKQVGRDRAQGKQKIPEPPAVPPSVRARGQRAKPPASETVAREAREQRPSRFVLLELLAGASGGEWRRIEPTLQPGLPYAILLYIGEPRVNVVAADSALDERQLPPSSSGHPLSIAFTPLWKDDAGVVPPAQIHRVHLPPQGDSTPALFYFKAPGALDRFRARVVVLHRNRVLQTLMLDLAPQAGVHGELRLRAENVVTEDFGERTEAPAFAAALIVNDNSQGVTGLTAIVDDSATFVEPEGLKLMISDIRKELAALNVAEGSDADAVVNGLDDERVHRMLFGLAMRGAALAKMLKRQPSMAPFLSAPKLQVVDAVPGAYLPVEFIYDGRAPAPGAVRCPNAAAALADLAIHRSCPNNKDENHYCPAAFWGFSRCIERQPCGNQVGYKFAHPQPGSNTLKPLRKALLAASRRVRPTDLDAPNGLEGILAGAAQAVVRAQSWNDWRTKVGTESPSLLVLLPHSLESPLVAHMPALEISGTNIESARMDEEFVCAEPPQNPIVLLLGCSTTLPDVAFLDFVHEFKASGAAVTIGTVATIRGRQTNDFVRELLAQMKLAAADGAHTFDEIFLMVKQRLLAKGDPFVLSLVAYGDTGWRIQT